jgi:hypothetical protein
LAACRPQEALRVVIYAPLLAKTDPLLFDAMLDHGLAAAAGGLIPADARSLIQRVTRGVAAPLRRPADSQRRPKNACSRSRLRGLPTIGGAVCSCMTM